MRCWGPTIDLPNQKRQSAKVFIERSHNIDQINEGKWMEGRKRSEFQMNIFGIDYELHKLVFCFSALLFLSQSTPHSVVRPLNYVSEVCASTSAVQLNLLRVRQKRQTSRFLSLCCVKFVAGNKHNGMMIIWWIRIRSIHRYSNSIQWKDSSDRYLDDVASQTELG